MDAFVVRKTNTFAKLPRPGRKRHRSGGALPGRSTEVVDVLESDSEASHSDAHVPRRTKNARVSSSSSSSPGAFAIMMEAAREKPTEFYFGLQFLHGKATTVLLPASAGQAKWSSKMKLGAKIAGTRKGAVVNLWTDCPARSVSEPHAGSASTTFSSGQLKSLLQKCIRRGQSSAASRCVYEMWQHGDPMILELSRRLPIVCIEDVLAQPGMTAAVWLAAAISKGYKPVAECFLPLLAGLAHSAASCPVHDPINRYPAAEDATRINTLYNEESNPCSAELPQKSTADEPMQVAEGRSRSLCNVSLVALQHRFGLLKPSTAASGDLTRSASIASSGHALKSLPSVIPRLQQPAVASASSSSSISASSTTQQAPAQAEDADAKSLPRSGTVRSGRDTTGAALCFALLLRRALGGMRGDMAMLAGAQRTWQLRLACRLPEPARASKSSETTLDGLRLSLEPPPWVRHESAAGGRDSRDLWCTALQRLSGWGAATNAGCSTSWSDSIESWTTDRLGVVQLPRVVDLGGGVRISVEAGYDWTGAGDAVSQQGSRSSASAKAPSAQAASMAASGPHSAPVRTPRFDAVVAYYGLDCHCSRVLDGALVELGRQEAAAGSHGQSASASGAVLDKEQYSRAMWVFWSGLNVRRSLLGEWAPEVARTESTPATKGRAVSETATSSGAIPTSVLGRRHAEALQAHQSWASGSATSLPLVRLLHDGPFDVLHSIWPRSDSDKAADAMDRDAASALSGPRDVAERVRQWAMWRRVLPFVERQARSLMRRKSSA